MDLPGPLLSGDPLVATGTLYVVATPLGHLEDLTRRAADILTQVPVVAAEDTRRTRPLLSLLGARPVLVSYHAHSGEAREEAIMDHLAAGRDVALVTDAGTPGLSDPGARLVSRVREWGAPIVPIPGPSAVTTALSAAGFPADHFLFAGFLPRRGADRRAMLQRLATEPWTAVLFEAANRLVALLDELAALGPADRHAVVGREMTKVHEEFREGTLTELARYYRETPPRGEVTLVLEGVEPIPDVVNPEDLQRRISSLLAEGLAAGVVARRVAAETGVPRNEVYRLILEL